MPLLATFFPTSFLRLLVFLKTKLFVKQKQTPVLPHNLYEPLQIRTLQLFISCDVVTLTCLGVFVVSLSGYPLNPGLFWKSFILLHPQYLLSLLPSHYCLLCSLSISFQWPYFLCSAFFDGPMSFLNSIRCLRGASFCLSFLSNLFVYSLVGSPPLERSQDIKFSSHLLFNLVLIFELLQLAISTKAKSN